MSKDNLKITDFTDFSTKTDFYFHELKYPFMDEVIPVALDIGYSATKVYSAFGKHIFPSLPVRVRKDEFLQAKPNNIRYKDEKGVVWYIGDLAREHIEPGKTMYQESVLFEKSRISSEEYLVLLRVGIYLGLLQNFDKYVRNTQLSIVTGLPEEYLDTIDADILKAKFIGHHHFSVAIGSNEYKTISFDIEANDLTIMSQPVGTLWSILADREGRPINYDMFKTKRILIFDGGFHTIDTFFNKAGQKGTSLSFNNLAMHEVYSRTCENILENTKTKVKVYELDNYINNIDHPGEVPYGDKQYYSFIQDFMNNLEEVAKENVNALLGAYGAGVGLNQIDLIICTGGTGKAYFPYFEKALQRVDIVLAEKLDGKKETDNFNTVFSNVVGYFNYLASLLKNKYAPAVKTKKEIAIAEDPEE